MEYKQVVFIVDGGIGKNIMATSVVRCIKQQYPNLPLIVVASHPDVFKHNPHIKKCYPFSNPLFFFEDNIQSSFSLILKADPYCNSDYVFGRKHLIPVWCSLLDIKYDEIRPEIYLTKKEIDFSQEMLRRNKVDADKLVLIQWQGGPMEKCDPSDRKKQQKRAIPLKIAQTIANNIKDKGYTVWSIQYPQQPQLVGVHVPLASFKDNNPAMLSQRHIFALITLCKTTVCIDSFVQHACAALGKKAVVLWGGTHPNNLGYDLHENLVQEVCSHPFCGRPNSFLFDGESMNGLWECSYDEACLDYDPDEITKLIE
jgi:ADP-heptose:LPS heptosyltransferase